ncbi:MAG: histidine--tRNA ligase [Melioribacteraceae bacterium]|nr:histidine--tRNA ligase [Melioribacteraceae bacterium]
MIKSVTGTNDILPSDIQKWHFLEDQIRDVFSHHNYKEIRTPIFESTNLFSRGIGEGTDIVSKEMYTFNDRSGESLTLRPEMTASVVRAFIEHSLEKKMSVNKLYYVGAMFRQERPQAGRFRQFHQFGAEALGSHDPSLDAEMIIMAYDIFSKLGLKNLVVKINSLGIPECREEYRKELKNFIAPHFNELSAESKKRFDTNILRVLDSKDERDQSIVTDAPVLLDFLDEESKNHFNYVQKVLANSNIPFEIDPKLVRGLDYYTHTTFEVISGSVGSQSALCGGGRYNGLIKELGGPELPGVGFASGMERVLLACENENSLDITNKNLDVYLILIEKELKEFAFNKLIELRRIGISAELDYQSRSIKAQMREANKLNASYTLFIGGEEFSRNELVLKNMLTGEQVIFNTEDFDQIIKKIKEN